MTTNPNNIFPNVRWNNREGQITLSTQEVSFQAYKYASAESVSLLHTYNWPCEAIAEFAIKPSTSSVELRIQDDIERSNNTKVEQLLTIAFETQNTGEMFRLCQAITEAMSKNVPETEKTLPEGSCIENKTPPGGSESPGATVEEESNNIVNADETDSIEKSCYSQEVEVEQDAIFNFARDSADGDIHSSSNIHDESGMELSEEKVPKKDTSTTESVRVEPRDLLLTSIQIFKRESLSMVPDSPSTKLPLDRNYFDKCAPRDSKATRKTPSPPQPLPGSTATQPIQSHKTNNNSLRKQGYVPTKYAAAASSDKSQLNNKSSRRTIPQEFKVSLGGNVHAEPLQLASILKTTGDLVESITEVNADHPLELYPLKMKSCLAKDKSNKSGKRASFAGPLVMEPEDVLSESYRSESHRSEVMGNQSSLSLRSFAVASPMIRESRQRREHNKVAASRKSAPTVLVGKYPQAPPELSISKSDSSNQSDHDLEVSFRLESSRGLSRHSEKMIVAHRANRPGAERVSSLGAHLSKSQLMEDLSKIRTSQTSGGFEYNDSIRKDEKKRSAIDPKPQFEESQTDCDAESIRNESQKQSYSLHDRESYLSCNDLVEAVVVDESADFHRDSVMASAVEIDKSEMQLERRKFLVKIACCCLISIIVTVILIIVLATPSFEPTDSIKETPLTDIERFQLFEARASTLVYNNTQLQDQGSPESLALHWIAETDPMYRSPLDVETHLEEKFNQRYLLALFYFSMEPFEHCKAPETGEVSACVHPLLESYSIEGVYYEQHMKEQAFRWLSDADECKWGGVTCEDDFHVSHLHLAGYKLQGKLPIEIAGLNHLRTLDLQKNNLQGSLPLEWGILDTTFGLQSIRLDDNLFTGSLPEEWCQLNSTTMREMILAGNDLTGTLPSCLSRLTALESFSVMQSAMTGTIPSELGRLSNLQTIHLAGNNFHGDFPVSVCVLQNHHLFEASTDCLNIHSHSYVECSCCSKCCDGNNQETCDLLN